MSKLLLFSKKSCGPCGLVDRYFVAMKDERTELLEYIDLEDVAPKGKTLDGRDHPGLSQKAGHICFCGHGDEVAFRNIRIKKVG